MKEDRKTLDQRAQMTEIERLRHSTAHVLATAIACHSEWSEAQSRNLSFHE
jgi:threonyl-tRNA synthetase